MRINPEDLKADITELADRVRDADRRIRKLQLELAAASQVYDQLSRAWRQLSDLAELHRQLPTIWGAAKEHAECAQKLPY